jgi:hypothetical protein
MESRDQIRNAVQDEAAQTAGQARSATREVGETATEQARQVGREAGQQARRVADDARERLSGELDSQTGRAAGGLRQWADELDRMAEAGAGGSPVHTAVRRLSDGGRQAADYLDEHGVSGVVERVGRFARRRPGTFLIGAAAAGFLAGRLARATATAGSADGPAPGGGEPPGGMPSPPAPATSAGVPPATSYGSTPYEDGGQATPPAGPTGQVR